MDILLAIGLVLIGFVIGLIVGRLKRADGSLIVDDYPDENRTKWVLNVESDPDDIVKKKSIRLIVRIGRR